VDYVGVSIKLGCTKYEGRFSGQFYSTRRHLQSVYKSRFKIGVPFIFVFGTAARWNWQKSSKVCATCNVLVSILGSKHKSTEACSKYGNLHLDQCMF
jgi:hypothetical protein